MGRVLEQFAKHAKMDADTIETELFAAIRALEIEPKDMTVDDLRQCLLIYLDEVFYGVSPEKTQQRVFSSDQILTCSVLLLNHLIFLQFWQSVYVLCTHL